MTRCGDQLFVKDISIFGLDVKDITIVDDNDIVTCLYPDRHIKIKPYYGEVDDTELLKLMKVL